MQSTQMFAQLNDLFLDYVAVSLIFVLGIYFTLKSRFMQIRSLPHIIRDLVSTSAPGSPQSSQGTSGKHGSAGAHPLKVFFASVGGMIGIGNVVAVATAVQVGGPGALFWVWMAALVGSLIKYSEIYLGHKYRVPNQKSGFDGGPMYFLRQAFSSRWVPLLICLLLCVYGTEVYQFSVIVDSVTSNWNVERMWVVPIFLGLVIYAGWGGVNRVGAVCAALLPIFSLLYVLMSGFIFFSHLGEIPALLQVIFRSAFTGHAAMGGFAGSTALIAIQQGLMRAAYSADIGIGYDSIIQSESRIKESHRQARFAILGVFLDSFMCTCSVLLILITGVWKEAMPASHLVQTALSLYFPYMDIFMPLFIIVLGYTTLIAYFCVGLKCSKMIHPRYGNQVYLVYSIAALSTFSFYSQTHALMLMAGAQTFILILNLTGIFRLRKEIYFE